MLKEKILTDLRLGKGSKLINLIVDKFANNEKYILLTEKEELLSQFSSLFENKKLKAISIDIHSSFEKRDQKGLYQGPKQVYRIFFYSRSLHLDIPYGVNNYAELYEKKKKEYQIKGMTLSEKGISEIYLLKASFENHWVDCFFLNREFCQIYNIEEFPKNIRVNFNKRQNV